MVCLYVAMHCAIPPLGGVYSGPIVSMCSDDIIVRGMSNIFNETTYILYVLQRLLQRLPYVHA